ncbi:hypothetical protein Bhyg_03713 [Pseudolycoriella hygida]|uniref:Uncharacterized protein n=1 Tax=Pseudolycoriella hygida TaxID=35572 RepID=A0A9Q0NDU0_9DIPT|nr:hypothetical protein Bhyg_03713 [Pseudolycoriella hygida]
MNTLKVIIVELLLIFGTIYSNEIDEPFESANLLGSPTEKHLIVRRNSGCPGGYKWIIISQTESNGIVADAHRRSA